MAKVFNFCLYFIYAFLKYSYSLSTTFYWEFFVLYDVLFLSWYSTKFCSLFAVLIDSYYLILPLHPKQELLEFTYDYVCTCVHIGILPIYKCN